MTVEYFYFLKYTLCSPVEVPDVSDRRTAANQGTSRKEAPAINFLPDYTGYHIHIILHSSYP
jgi:hypothetical protein